MSERIYRDSVHNIIRSDTDSPEGRLIAKLIDTPEFQRLRRIRQLGLAYFAYQTAEHSRFAHSLGAYHLATRVLERLSTKYKISDGEATVVRVAALLHDIGHGPFSHVIESILGFHHEQFSIDAILSKETGVGALLAEYSSDLAGDVASIIRGDHPRRALAQMVSSQIDVDRMDYLLRDSHMTGVKYGVYDLEWMIKSIEIDVENDRLYVSAPGKHVVESYLQARYYMFRQVYYHRTLRSAEAVLRSVIRRALDLFASGAEVWHVADPAFEAVLSGRRLTLGEHLSLDDSDFVFHIKRWQRSSDPILSDLASRFVDRRLFRAFDLDMEESLRPVFVESVRRLVASHDLDPDYYVIEDSTGDEAYNFYTTDASDTKNLIYVEDGFSKPVIREISEVSPAVRGLQAGYRIHRVCFPAELTDEVSRIYHS